MQKMKQYWLKKGLMFGLFILVGGTLVSLAVMLLWNALLPSILGLGTITFWQAAGILLLSRMLFGGHCGRGRHWGGGHHKRREEWKKRWSNMSPEEREKMKQHWKSRCGHRGHHDHWDHTFPGDDTDSSLDKQAEPG